ncbi:MAG: hypothetical protein IKH30_18465 [Clostridia bacterium]|nr:hypothetical protein [Clostridia bacterium]MBR4539508.1 hypothetical protein [Clostridia bacterium]
MDSMKRKKPDCRESLCPYIEGRERLFFKNPNVKKELKMNSTGNSQFNESVLFANVREKRRKAKRREKSEKNVLT